tara:strand:- start:270 stop:389 length:120 start_codon:yes stop_codon:yes gene_type:complete
MHLQRHLTVMMLLLVLLRRMQLTDLVLLMQVKRLLLSLV